MSEWVSEWVNEWLNEWMSERVSEWVTTDWVNACCVKWVSEWVNEWVNEWVSEWVNEWESEWVSEWVSEWGTHTLIDTRLCVRASESRVRPRQWGGDDRFMGGTEKVWYTCTRKSSRRNHQKHFEWNLPLCKRTDAWRCQILAGRKKKWIRLSYVFSLVINIAL